MDLRDWLEIVLEYLKVLAWPMVVTAMLLVFRSAITNVLKRLVRVEGAGMSAELTEHAEAQARVLAAVSLPILAVAADHRGGLAADSGAPVAPITPSPQPDAPKPIPGSALMVEEHERELNDFLHRHSRKWEQHHPSDRVEGAWSALTEKAAEVGAAIGMPQADSRSISRVSNRLLKDQRIGIETVDLIDELAELRNRVTHDPRIQVTEAFADYFVPTANRVTTLFTHMLETLRL